MKKILFIAPHLSTGGLPQFLLKKIQSLINDYEVYCVEYDDITGGVLVVQRKQLQKICGGRFYTLSSNKFELFKLIDDIKPDIIHLEEMPEYFMDVNLTTKLYNKDREYLIVETSHDSSFDPKKKRVFPDQFTFVSNYQKQNLESLNVNTAVIEYPIAVKRRKNRTDGLNFLGLDETKKHILHVGLFTPRKNQKEFVEYARAMENENVQFHCLGNMADNFKTYWQPILGNLPSNVKVWGERKDVENFYSCMDLFLFTSRGHATDKETAPIVIKEAISYNIPSLLYNLPVYLNRYNVFENIKYLDETNFNRNVKLIKNKLGMIPDLEVVNLISNKTSSKDTVVIISTHPNFKAVEDTTLESINQAKKAGYKVLLSSHYPASVNLQKAADHYVYDANNPILKHNFYNRWTYDLNNTKISLYFPPSECDNYHGLAVLINYYNGISLANKIGYKNAICFNYDMIISDLDFSKLYDVDDILINKKAFFFYDKALEGDTFKTVFHGINTQFFLEKFKYYTSDDYMDFVTKKNISNGLEQFYYNKLISYKNDLHIDYTNNEETYLSNSKNNLFSMVEYLSVLRMKNINKFGVLTYLNNKVDDRINEIIIKKNGTIVNTYTYNVSDKVCFYLANDFENDNFYEIENNLYDQNKILLRSYKKSFRRLEDIDINGSIDITQ
jgi:hypothetical protein